MGSKALIITGGRLPGKATAWELAQTLVDPGSEPASRGELIAFWGYLKRQALLEEAQNYSPKVIAPLIPLDPGTLWRWRKTRRGGWANKVPVRVVRLVEYWLDEQERLLAQAAELTQDRLAQDYGCTRSDFDKAKERLRLLQRGIERPGSGPNF